MYPSIPRHSSLLNLTCTLRHCAQARAQLVLLIPTCTLAARSLVCFAPHHFPWILLQEEEQTSAWSLRLVALGLDETFERGLCTAAEVTARGAIAELYDYDWGLVTEVLRRQQWHTQWQRRSVLLEAECSSRAKVTMAAETEWNAMLEHEAQLCGALIWKSSRVPRPAPSFTRRRKSMGVGNPDTIEVLLCSVVHHRQTLASKGD